MRAARPGKTRKAGMSNIEYRMSNEAAGKKRLDRLAAAMMA
jgi:hypothetical protein